MRAHLWILVKKIFLKLKVITQSINIMQGCWGQLMVRSESFEKAIDDRHIWGEDAMDILKNPLALATELFEPKSISGLANLSLKAHDALISGQLCYRL